MSIPFAPAQFETKSKPIRTMPTRKVRVDKLDASQATFDEAKIEKMAAKDPTTFSTVPLVAKHNGRYVVQDGHHRVAAAMLNGDTHISVRISR